MYENNIQDIIAAQNGEEEALERLVKNNNGLLYSIVKRFSGRGYETEDLYQIASMGFIKAIKRFDTGFEVQISTYAVPYILGEIKRFIRDDGPVKISRSIKELSIKINELQKEYYKKNGEEISLQQLSKELNLPKEEIALAIDTLRPVESIDSQADTGGDDDRTLLDKVSTNKDEATNIVNKLALKQIISSLENREKEIILLRYYKEKTQMQVSKILGISQVQVSRIEKKVLEKMKLKWEAI